MTQERTKHTLLPWRTVRDNYCDVATLYPGVSFRVVYADSGDVAYIWPMHADDGNANAEFIVRACNSHASLLAALKELRRTTPSVDEFRLLVVGIGGVSKEAKAIEPRIEAHKSAIEAAGKAIKEARP